MFEKDWKVELAGIVLVVLIFNFFAKWFLKSLQTQLHKQRRFWSENFVKALYLPISYYAWLFAIIHVINLVAHKILQVQIGSDLNIGIKMGAVLAAAWFLLRWKNNNIITLRELSKTKEIVLEQGKIDVLNKLGTVLIFFLLVLTLLEVTGRSITTLIAFGGVGGLALAIASQEVVGNFFGGLMIYITHPFAVGDKINLQEKSIEGRVEDIGWYMTRVRNKEKQPVYIPNSIFTKAIVITPSRMTHHRFQETFGVRYADMPRLKKIISDIEEMLKHHPAVDKEQKIKVYFEAFAPHSLDVMVSAFVPTTDDHDDFNPIRQDLLMKTYDILAENKAELAIPVTYFEMKKD